MRRFGQLIKIDPARLEEYATYHADIWPEIADALRAAEIRNYSIYVDDDTLFAYFEYHGPDDEFDDRMDAVAAAPRMREWWDIMESIQRPLPTRADGEWWKNMREVFHLD